MEVGSYGGGYGFHQRFNILLLHMFRIEVNADGFEIGRHGFDVHPIHEDFGRDAEA